MKKYLIYSDMHWSTYSSIIRRRGQKYSVRLHNLINTMNWLEDLAIKEHCDEEICCGDFFDRPSLEAEELTALQDVKWNNLHKTFIVGNHESNINNLEYSSTKALESLNVRIINSPLISVINDKVNFYFIPYITSDKTLKLEDVIDINKDKKAVVFAHSDIAGLQYGKFTSQSGFDIKDIEENCNMFIDGHLHNEMVIDNKVILVGNTTGQNFNENALVYDHLAYILTVEDDGKLKMEPIENPYAFNFYKIKVECKEDLDKLMKLKTNAVVSLTCSDQFVNNAETILNNNSNVIEHRTMVIYETQDDGCDNILKVEDHLKQFIEFVQTKIEPSPALSDELARLGGGE